MTPEQALIDIIRGVEEESILFIKGKPVVIRPASDEDLERITKGFMWEG